MLRRALLLTLLTAVATSTTTPGRAAERATIFAAASTTPAIQAIAEEYRKETGVVVTPVFAASGALARQIDNGAPADLYLSADTGWMDWLARRNRVDRRRVRTLLSNCLVLIQPAGAAAPLAFDTTLAERLGGERLAIADPELAPAGAYARAALRAQGLWRRIENRLALQPNVRATLALAERGEVAAAIVYRSDALGARNVRAAATIPSALHPPITYPVAPVGSFVTGPAARFLEYLRSSAAAAVFARFGFIEPGASCSD